jgi:GNAT superfamily N-acetyltransferase
LEDILIQDYHPTLAPYFKSLNVAWINHYFTLEEHDLHQLENPEESILKGGGAIMFAQYQTKIVATCALIKTGNNEFELAKMGVDENYRGKQIGYKLLTAAVTKAKTLGATKVWLGSSTILAQALKLYTRFGFKQVPLQPSPYARADVRMELDIS